MKNVYKKYANGVVATNGINIEIDRGEFVYVVGPSGAGKSTFIKMIYREEVPTSGEIIFDKINIAQLKQKKSRNCEEELALCFRTLNYYQN